MTFNKRQDSQNSIKSYNNNIQSVFTSDDCGDYTHNICEMDRGVHIKNSFDEWKSKVGQPYCAPSSKVQET